MSDGARRRFFEHFAVAIDQGDAALFIGAGLSVSAGYVDWRGLLREIADELGLIVDQESDLVSLAQYHVNSASHRGRLNRTLIEEFTRDAKVTATHRQLAGLSIRTVWTTNYDTLIEQAYGEIGKRVDVKADARQLVTTLPKRDVTLYKMHGDIARPDDAVLIKDDYELYHRTRGDFVTALNGDLLEKHFLFLGFSFTDPNIDQILARVRAAHGDASREHYWIVRRPAPARADDQADRARHEYESTKISLRVADLRRYGIHPVWIDDYTEVESIVSTLARLSLRRSVFVSGSAAEAGAFGEERLERLAFRLGASLIDAGFRVVSGLGLGIGAGVLLGAVERVIAHPQFRIEDRLALRPFPQPTGDPAARATMWTAYREDMLRQARFAVFLAGNARDAASGSVSLAHGVREEFEIARRQGVFPIPIGATGYQALELWREVTGDLASYFPDVDVVAADLAAAFADLGDPAQSDETLVATTLRVMDQVRRALVT